MTSEPDPDVPPAGLVAGKYRIIRLLGRGGMGAVWEGVHAELGNRVAVKFIDNEYATSDDVRQRFVNEAKAAARLRSKHVVQVYDQGVGEDGRPYIVMEFLFGEPLDRRLDRVGRLSPAEAAKMALHVSRALAKAHENGIVHRDLKPENVFLVHDDEDHTDLAKVVDFGIAKFTDPAKAGSSSTRTGAVLGTPQYMSPEQARGLRSVDYRTDLWSLGVIVYRCLVGSLPFKGEAMGDLLVNICTADPPRPSLVESGVPSGFDGWVERALAREPGDRFQSAAELCDSLAELCGVEARLGPTSGATRVQWPASAPALVEGRAVTEGPFATTNGPTARLKGPLVAVLALVFFVVALAAALGARAALRAGVEPKAAVRAAVAPSPPAPAAPAIPVVTPITSAGDARPSASASDRPSSERAHRAASRPAPTREKPRPGAPEPKPAEAPKPAQKPDLLGY